MFCVRCGRSSSEGASFCWHCGSPLRAGIATPAGAPAPSQASTDPVVVPAAPWPAAGGAAAASGPWGESPGEEGVREPWPAEPVATGEPASGEPREPWTAPAETAPAPWAPAPAAVATPVYAGFWRRFWAAFLDGMIVWALSVPFMILWVLPHLAGAPVESWGDAERMAYAASFLLYWGVASVVEFLYFALLESSKHQATLGKLALSLRVTDIAGARISFGRALGRRFARLLSSFTLGIGFLVMLFSDRRQTLHDMMAGTLVVRRTS